MVEKITKDEVAKMMSEENKIHLIEVLDEKYYKDYHLPGAINIPVHSTSFLDLVREKIPNLNDHIIVYCQNSTCEASPEAAAKLDQLGYENVYDYEGGKEEWRDLGYKIEKGEPKAS